MIKKMRICFKEWIS